MSGLGGRYTGQGEYFGRPLTVVQLLEERKAAAAAEAAAAEAERAAAAASAPRMITYANTVAKSLNGQRAAAAKEAAAEVARVDAERERLLAMRNAPPSMEGLGELTATEKEYLGTISDLTVRRMEELRLRLAAGRAEALRAKQPPLAELGGIGSIGVVRYGPDGSRMFGETPSAFAAAAPGAAAAPEISKLMRDLGISFEAAAALVEIYKNFKVPTIYTGIMSFISTHLKDKIALLEESQRSKYTNMEWVKHYIDRLKQSEMKENDMTPRGVRPVPKPGTFQYRSIVTMIQDLNSEIKRRDASAGGAGDNYNLGGGYRKSKRSKSRKSQKKSRKSQKSQKKSRSRR